MALSDSFTLRTATELYPQKTLEQIQAAVDFIRKRQESVQVRVEEFSSPVEYMVRLRGFRKEFPIQQSGESGKANIYNMRENLLGMPVMSIEALVHSLSDDVCVKWQIPKVFKETSRFLANQNCPDCGGTGGTDKSVPTTGTIRCPECGGTGKKITGGNTGRVGSEFKPCPKCRGEKKINVPSSTTVRTKCSRCKGTGKVDGLNSRVSILVLSPSYNRAEGEGSKK